RLPVVFRRLRGDRSCPYPGLESRECCACPPFPTCLYLPRFRGTRGGVDGGDGDGRTEDGRAAGARAKGAVASEAAARLPVLFRGGAPGGGRGAAAAGALRLRDGHALAEPDAPAALHRRDRRNPL